MGGPLPRPKAVYPQSGRFEAPKGAAVRFPLAARYAAERIAAHTRLPLAPLTGHDPKDFRIVVGLDRPTVTAPLPPARPDAYSVTVRPDRIELVARSVRGLDHATSTLLALGTGCGRVVDFPDLELRGVHLDLKGPALRVDYLHRLLHQLADRKINTLLVEYDDKFPYSEQLGLAAPDALTRDELDAFLEAAAERGVEVIPLVQCLGHLEYALRLPAYRHLAEDERYQQLCPLRPESLEFFASALGEVLSAHPDARMVHIGGDEPWSLGTCVRCRAHAAEHGRADLYARYVARAAELVVQARRRPVIWDDVLHAERDPALVERLPAETVVMSWEYQEHAGRSGFVRWGGPPRIVAPAALRHRPDALPGFPAEGEFVELESLPEAEQRLLRAVKYPAGEGHGRPLPWLRALTALGRQVIGAAAARGADGENECFPRWGRRLANLTLWARRARAEGALGMVSTAWAAYDTITPPCEPLATAHPLLAAAAELGWNSDTDEDTLRRLLGPVVDGWAWLERGLAEPESRYLASALELFESLPADGFLDPRLGALCARHALLVQQTDRVARAASWHLLRGRRTPGVGEDPTLHFGRRHVLDELHRLLGEWQDWQQHFADAVAEYYAGDGAAWVAQVKVADPVRRLRSAEAELR